MILKFRKNISEWCSLYANAIKNRLRRDLNLSDVCDVQETRDNIGLSGNNNHTHYHDDRYIPIIEKRINELDNKVNNLIPIGTIMTWPSNVPPDTYRWLECNGQSFNPTEFPDLYKVFPNGRVPDLRGVFLRGYGSQSSYTSGALGQLQGDAMRRIYGDIPNVMIGNSLFGSYNWDMISFAGSPSLSAPWDSHKITNRSYGTMILKIPVPEYVLTGSCNPGEGGSCNYSLRDQNKGRVIGIEVNNYQYREFPNGSAIVSSGLGNVGFVYRTVNIDSKKIVPTANEVRPANIAVKFYIRSR